MMNPEGGVAMTGHNHGGKPNEKMENMSVASRKSTVSDDVKKSLQPLFDNYFKMKAALVNDDYKKAKETGKEMNISLSKINMNLFKGEATRC